MAPEHPLYIEAWPEESREAAQLVIDQYGKPDEITETQLMWHKPGPWKRMVASKAFYQHNFPAPHIDAVESVIDYHVPVEKFTPLSEFDGSVVIERTAGEVSARCHDEHANFLALNLMRDGVRRFPAQEADTIHGTAQVSACGPRRRRSGHANAIG